jgi:hypothetical protein
MIGEGAKMETPGEKITLINRSTVRAMFLASFERVMGQGGLLKSLVGI